MTNTLGIFSAERAYSAQQDGATATPFPDALAVSAYEFHSVGAIHLASDDPETFKDVFAVFGSLSTQFRNEHPQGYLVATSHEGRARIIPGDIVNDNPDTYITPQLESLIEVMGPDELLQFELHSLAQYIKQKRT